MLDLFTREIEKLAQDWRTKADIIGEYSGGLSCANTLRVAANEMVAMNNRVRAQAARLSVQQYATQHGIQPDTVRRWVRSGQLPAAKGADGSWSIPYGAVRRKLRKVA